MQLDFEALRDAFRRMWAQRHTLKDVAIEFNVGRGAAQPPPDEEIRAAVQAAFRTDAQVTVVDVSNEYRLDPRGHSRDYARLVTVDIGEDDWTQRMEADFFGLVSAVSSALKARLPTVTALKSPGYVHRQLNNGTLTVVVNHEGWQLQIEGTGTSSHVEFGAGFDTSHDFGSEPYVYGNFSDDGNYWDVSVHTSDSRYDNPISGVDNVLAALSAHQFTRVDIDGEFDPITWATPIIEMVNTDVEQSVRPARVDPTLRPDLDALQAEANRHQDERVAAASAKGYRELQAIAKQRGLKATGKKAALVERVAAPTFSDLAWAPVNDRYNHAVLPTNAPAPTRPDRTCDPAEDSVTLSEFQPGDHIVHRTRGTECFNKGTIDHIVRSGGRDPVNRASLKPWFDL